MAKTIKFNLILDEKPVRTIDGIRENFSIEDMLKYLKNGMLLKWLDVRGFNAEYEKIAQIDKESDDKTLLKELIKTFGMEVDDKEIDFVAVVLEHMKRAKTRDEEYKKSAFSGQQIIEDYHKRYETLIAHMVENRNNMAVLKADAIELEHEYIKLFSLGYRQLYDKLAEQAPKAIFAILLQPGLRDYWINDPKKAINKDLKMNLMPKAKEILGGDVKCLTKGTYSKWEQIVPKGVKIMVIAIRPFAFVRNAGKVSEELSDMDVNGKFPILDGLDISTSFGADNVVYMEV